MSSKQEIFQTALTSPYNAEGFVNFVREMISGVRIVAPYDENITYNTFAALVSRYFHIGEFEDGNGDFVGIFSVELKRGESVERARTAQRAFIKTLLEKGNYAGALVAFYSMDDTQAPVDTWRFSFIRMDYEFAKGKIKESLTPAKRYSYLVGRGEPCHTAMDRLLPIFMDDNSAPTLDELEEAFSVESVTNEFFELYKEKYFELKEYLESNKDFVQESEYRGFTSEQFAKKLMSQIVFLYFIQKKGWLGVNAVPKELTEKEYKKAFFSHGSKSREVVGKVYYQYADKYLLDGKALSALSDEDKTELSQCVIGQPWGTGDKQFMRKIFNYSVGKEQNFFDDCLEPLFYEALNKDRDANEFFPLLRCRIPFMNGGLFEELDGYDWKHNDFAIPNDMFSNEATKGKRDADGILDIFDRYNFTMAEDEPMEREVAIDPEMLGKVFENLLDAKDRKKTGSFYTPREIVHYMCQESLINYLVTRSGIPEEDIRKLVLYGEYFRDSDTEKTLSVDNETGKVLVGNDVYTHKHHMELDKNKDFEIPPSIFSYKNGVNRLQELDDLLANVKVVDPAVGSGAFPLGMVNEIVKVRDTLTSYLTIEMNYYQKKNIYAFGRNMYAFKAETIKNCIFACDIEPSATDIAKLRLWLSLVIEDETVENPDERFAEQSKPKQLPNLDCNIICGNSLIDSFEGFNLISESDVINNINVGHQENLMQAGVDKMISTLVDLQDKLFYTTDHFKKEEIKAEIHHIYDIIIEEQLKINSDLLEEYRESKTASSLPFILWQLYFPKVFCDNGGFDICIGNPPYLKEAEYKEVFEPIYRTAFGQKYGEGKMNYWYFFFHKGMDILNDNGTLSFIAPNYFIAGSGASKLNNRLVNESRIIKYVDFNKTKVFATADIQCMIIVTEKAMPTDNTTFTAYLFKHGIEREEVGKIVASIDTSQEVDKIVINEQGSIMLKNGKINFANSKYYHILQKIESHNNEQLFKATQGIVENPSSLSNKNIGTLQKKTGIDTSCYQPNEEVFVISKNNLKSLQFTKAEKDLLREYHDPSDIHRYMCDYSFHKYLLYITKDTVNDIDDFPNIKNHLEKYKPFMEIRRETQKGTVKWYQLHWPRREAVFKNEKIVYPQMCKIPTFAYSTKPFFTNMSANIIYKTSDVDLKALTAILNSKLAHFWLLNRAKNRGVGLDIAVAVIDEFPVTRADLSNETLKKLSAMVIDKAYLSEDYSNLDEDIDTLVYSLYGLNQDEIMIIEKYIYERTL